MADATVRDCRVDEGRLAPIRECMENYGVGAAGAEWPHNCISTRAVAYSCGALGRAGDAIPHEHDPAELAFCRRLSAEAAGVMEGVELGMGSESESPLDPFFVAAKLGAVVPGAITEDLIRAAFGGTIHPDASVVVEPLEERGAWWQAVRDDSQDDGYAREDEEAAAEADTTLGRWRGMIRWFREHGELSGAAFVMIGHDDPGVGCVFPRLALGLTRAGSLVGLCGHVVQT